MPTRFLPRALLGVVAVLSLLALLLATARLQLGDTVLLPGTEAGGVREVSGEAAELSLAVDVRNGGLLPLVVEGPEQDRIGPYAVLLGRGGPGGGVPEEERFAPFTLWPGQQRLVVLHLERAGDAAPVELGEVALRTSVAGVPRVLRVELPTALRVGGEPRR